MHLSLVKSCVKEEVWDGRIVALSSSSSSGIWCREDRNMAARWMKSGEGGGGRQVMQPWILTLPYNLALYPGCLFVFFVDEQPGYKATYNQV